MSLQEIDELVREKFFPQGVFYFFDHVGIDVMLASVKAYTINAFNKEFYAPLIAGMDELVRANDLGIKTGKGFYNYSKAVRDKANSKMISGIPVNHYDEAEKRLRGYYKRSVQKVIDSGLVIAEQLASYLKDYLGIDEDPFEL